jgi:hypothetical protein
MKYCLRPFLSCILLCLVGHVDAQNWQWAKTGTVAHPSESSIANAVATDPSGNVYIAGTFATQSLSIGAFTLTNAGSSGADIFVVKYNSAGTLLWAQSFGGMSDDMAYGLASDPLGNMYVTGGYNSQSLILGMTTLSNAGGEDIFLMKLDKNGNVIWAQNAGGIGNEIANSVCTDSRGNPSITGDFDSPFLSFGTTILIDTTGQTQPFITKFDSSGNVTWARTATGNGGGNGNFGSAISSDSASNIYVAGGFGFSTIIFGNQYLINYGATNMFITKYDSTGNVIWVQGAGGSGSDAATGIGTDKKGNVYVCGSFNSSTIPFGTTILQNAGASDVFVAKYSAAGNTIWASGSGGSGIDQARNLSVDPNGFVYVCGSFGSQSINFGPNQLTNNGFLNIFLTEFHPNGSVLWATSSGGSGSDFALSSNADAYGNAFIAGYFNSSFLSFGSNTLVATGQSNMLVAKVTGVTGIEKPSVNSDQIFVFPNPADDFINFRVQGEFSSVNEIILTNCLAEEVKQFFTRNNNLIILPLNDLKTGVYFYSALDFQKNILARGKIVIR